MSSCDADALVIGAGPAGASAAIRLAQAGWRVTLIEQSSFPRTKVCGECLSPASLRLLDELGIGTRVLEWAGPEIRQVGWMTRTRTAIADMPACASGSRRYGCAIGRDRLDTLLLARARELGVRVIQPARVRLIRGAPGAFRCEYRRRPEAERRATPADDGTISARLVLDAHGSWEIGPANPENSPGERRRAPARNSDLLAFKASFRNTALPSGILPVFALPGGYGGMVVADGGRITVACCLRRDRLHECRLAAPGESAGAAVEAYLRRSCRGVAAALHGALREQPWQSVGPLRPGFAARAPAGVLPIGNAAVEAHPLIGEGICLALQSAAILAEVLGPPRAPIDACLTRELQRRYARTCRAAFSQRLRLSRIYAYVAMHPSLAAYAAILMHRWPHALTRAALFAGKARADTLDRCGPTLA
jgi:2-polyprenyl-6-methoxyphenol hydroxylase-like FAD-dependent oxidoreductase